jgi:hypothetical protein
MSGPSVRGASTSVDGESIVAFDLDRSSAATADRKATWTTRAWEPLAVCSLPLAIAVCGPMIALSKLTGKSCVIDSSDFASPKIPFHNPVETRVDQFPACDGGPLASV